MPLVTSFSTSDPTLCIRILFLSIFVSIVLLLVLFSKDGIDMQIVKHPFSIIYLLLICSYIISTYINGFIPEGKIIILKLYLFYVFLLFVLHLLRKYGIEFILKPILYFSLTVSLLYFVQVADFYLNLFDFNLEKTNFEFNKLASTMTNRNLMVSVQFLCLPFIIYLYTISNKFFKKLCVFTILLFVLSLVLLQTRAVFAAIFVFVFVMMLFNRSLLNKKHYIYIFLSVILFSFTYPQDIEGDFKLSGLSAVYYDFVRQNTSIIINDNYFFNNIYSRYSIKNFFNCPFLIVNRNNYR